MCSMVETAKSSHIRAHPPFALILYFVFVLQMARYVHDYFLSEGIPSVEIQPVDALLSEPVSSSLQLLHVSDDADAGSDASVAAGGSGGTMDVVFDAALSEDILDLDSTSDTWYRNHTFNG